MLFETTGITLMKHVATNQYIKFNNGKVSADLLKTKEIMNNVHC